MSHGVSWRCMYSVGTWPSTTREYNTGELYLVPRETNVKVTGIVCDIHGGHSDRDSVT